MKNLLIIIFVPTLIFICSCQKEQVDNRDYEKWPCTDGLPPSTDPEPIPIHISDSLQYEKPFFNPLNENEFVFQYTNGKNQLVSLSTYNMETRHKRSVYESDRKIIFSPARWSRSNWIAFEQIVPETVWGTPNFRMFIIRPDGTDLRLVYEQSRNVAPFFDYDGEYLYWRHESEIQCNILLSYHIESGRLDTLALQNALNCHVSRHHIIACDVATLDSDNYNTEHFIGISPLKTPLNFQPTVNYLPFGSTGLSTESIHWHPLGQGFYYVDPSNDVKYFDVVQNEINIIKENDICEFYYWSVSCSPDGSELLVERLYFEELPGSSILFKPRIYSIDLETGEETEVIIQ